MNNSDPIGVITRKASRTFGYNITNNPHLQQRKRSLSNKHKHSLFIPYKAHPELHPYLQDIAEHTRLRQHDSYIQEDYMQWNSDISTSMRELVVGWLIAVQPRLLLNNRTLYLSVFILDKYCHSKWVSRQRYQLLAVAGLFVAAKFEEVKTPKLRHYAELTQGVMRPQEILNMESDILTTLSFGIKVVTRTWHLEECLQLVDFGEEGSILCHYILDLSLVQFSFCLVRPSVVGWGAVLVVGQTRGLRLPREGEVAQRAGVSVPELREMKNLVSGMFHSRFHNKFSSVNKKYSSQLGMVS